MYRFALAVVLGCIASGLVFSADIVISAGNGYSLAARKNGSLWAWGTNSSAQLGVGTTSDAIYPVTLIGQDKVIAVAGGMTRSIALLTDGSVWAWGDNQNGYLGASSSDTCTGTYFSVPCAKAPVQVAAIDRIIAIASGDTYFAAVKSDGSVWGWGDNYGQGMFGNGSTSPSGTPAQVPGLSSIISVASGSGHALALDSAGQVWGWGYNIYGQLGSPTTGDAMPTRVNDLTAVQAIAAGGYQSLALAADGAVWGWGSIGGAENTAQPKRIEVPSSSSIAAGRSHALALAADGTVWSWGDNDYGQIGNGGQSRSASPVQVAGLVGIQAIAAGNNHSLAVDADGNVWVWGKIDGSSVAGIDQCQFSYYDTHGTNPTGNLITYEIPCAKTPRKILASAAQDVFSLNSSGTGSAGDHDRLFNYLQYVYPQYFPNPSASQWIGEYYVRYYAATDSYIGARNGRLYYLGPLSEREILDVGSVADWLQLAIQSGY